MELLPPCPSYGPTVDMAQPTSTTQEEVSNP